MSYLQPYIIQIIYLSKFIYSFTFINVNIKIDHGGNISYETWILEIFYNYFIYRKFYKVRGKNVRMDLIF